MGTSRELEQAQWVHWCTDVGGPQDWRVCAACGSGCMGVGTGRKVQWVQGAGTGVDSALVHSCWCMGAELAHMCGVWVGVGTGEKAGSGRRRRVCAAAWMWVRGCGSGGELVCARGHGRKLEWVVQACGGGFEVEAGACTCGLRPELPRVCGHATHGCVGVGVGLGWRRHKDLAQVWGCGEQARGRGHGYMGLGLGGLGDLCVCMGHGSKNVVSRGKIYI